MPAGVDVGAARIVAATDVGTTGTGNAALAVEQSDYVEDFLEGEDTPSIAVDGQVYALGDAAPEVATIVNDEPTRLLAADSTIPGAVVPEAVEALLDVLVGEGEGPLRYAPPADADASPVADAAAALGYEAAAIDPGLAVLYDVLEPPYTGLGVVVDGTRTLATLVVEGVPVARTQLERGGDWIDSELAEATGNDPEAVAELRANASLADPASGALALRYDTLLSNLSIAIAEDSVPLDQPVPVVVAGAAAPADIDSPLSDALAEVDIPFPVESVARAPGAAEAVARGALVAAQAGGDVETASPAPTAPGYAAFLADEDAATAALEAGRAARDEAAGDGADAGAAGSDGPTDDPSAADGGGVVAGGSAAGTGAATAAVDDVRERVGALEARLRVADSGGDEPLDESVEALADEVADLAVEVGELAGIADDVDGLSGEVDDVADAVEDVEAEIDDAAPAERLAAVESRLEALPPVADLVDLAERVDALDPEDVEAVGEVVETVRDRTDEVEAVAAEIEDVRADVADLGAAVEDVDAEVDDLDAEIGVVATDVDDVEVAVEDVEAAVEDVRTEVGDLGAGVDEVEVDVAALRERVEVVETTVEDAPPASGSGPAVEEVEALSDEVDDVDGRLSDLEGEVPDPDLVDALSVDLEALRGRVEELEASIEDRMNGLEETVDELDESGAEERGGLQGDVAGVETEIADLAERVDSLSSTVADLPTERASAGDDVRADLDDLRSEVAAIPTDTVDRNQHQVELNSLETRLEDVETSLRDLETAGDADGPGTATVAVLALGLVGLGGLGAALSFTDGQVGLAAAFVGVPVVASVLAWYLR